MTIELFFTMKFSSLGNLWKLGSRASSPAGTAGETRTSLFKQGISNGDPNKGIRTGRSKQADNARVAWQLSSAQTELSPLREYPRHQRINWATWNYLKNTVELNERRSASINNLEKSISYFKLELDWKLQILQYKHIKINSLF